MFFRQNLLILFFLLLITAVVHAQTSNKQLERARTLMQHGVLFEAATEYEKYILKAPRDTEARKEFIQILLKLKRYDKAILHIDELHRQKPKDPQVKEFLKQIEPYRRQKVRVGVEKYEHEIMQPDVKPWKILEYARYLTGAKKFSHAVEIYKKYLSMKPNDNKARYELAQQYAWKKRYNDCRRELEVVLSKDPAFTSAWMLLGDINNWQGKQERALAAYQQALKSKPSYEPATKKIRKIISSPGFREKRLKEAVAKNPEGSALNDLALYYFENDRVYEADALIQKRLNVAPTDAQAIELSKRIETEKKRISDEIIEVYRSRLTINSKDSTALRIIAKHYTTTDMFPEAIDIYLTYLKIYPNDYAVRLQLAYIYNWSGNYSEAIDEFRTVAFVLKYRQDANLGLAEALIANNENLQEAENIFKHDLVDHPDNIRSKLGYADALRKQGRFDEAENVYIEALETEPENERAKRGLESLKNDPAPLIQHLEAELFNNPDDETIRLRLAQLYYKTGRIFESEEQVILLLEKNPDDNSLKSMKKKLEGKKHTYLIDEIEKTKIQVQENPFDDELRIKYANLLAANKRADDAIQQFLLVLENRPNDIDVLLRLVEIYSASQRMEEAAEIYTRIADDNPGEFEYIYKLAQLLLWMGEYDRAITELNLAIHLEPESIETRVDLANAYRWSGNQYAAYDEYVNILALDPDNVDARRAIKEMSGAFFRGIYFQYHHSSDNEGFKLTEARIGATGTYSLKFHLRAGVGYISFEQTDSTGRFTPGTSGNFFFVQGIYNFDPITHLQTEVRYNILKRGGKNVYTDAYFIELERDFRKTQELSGVVGKLFYSSQDAVREVASTNGLLTWLNAMRADKVGFEATYEFHQRLHINGRLQYLIITDGNTRTDSWISGKFLLNKNIDLGIQYDSVIAQEERPEYWSPLSYATITGWGKFIKRNPRLSYWIRGAIGRVSKTNDSVRQLALQIDYKLNQRLMFGGGYSSLVTTRKDGKYSYSGWALSLVWSK